MHWIDFRVETLCLGVLALWGCHSKDHEAEKTLNAWGGKKVEIPANLAPRILGRDTTVSLAGMLTKAYCVLTFIDSTGCTECNMKLHDWHLRMNETSGFADKVNFVFIVHANNFAAVTAFAIKNKFDHLMFYDADKAFWKKNNNLPRRPDLQTFLLDRRNEVVLIGNPVNNKVLWDLYKKKITETENERITY